eukprot:1153130-Pelagomonas_calceolata.AAC.1
MIKLVVVLIYEGQHIRRLYTVCGRQVRSHLRRRVGEREERVREQGCILEPKRTDLGEALGESRLKNTTQAVKSLPTSIEEKRMSSVEAPHIPFQAFISNMPMQCSMFTRILSSVWHVGEGRHMCPPPYYTV